MLSKLGGKYFDSNIQSPVMLKLGQMGRNMEQTQTMMHSHFVSQLVSIFQIS